jgi:pimeloyl-ACP methyl ester carboxylesterase
VLADYLTRHGIAVLRYDDRGVAQSQGDFAASTSEDFTSDALSALSFLAKRPKVTADRVGILGHSEGGMIAPLAASRSADVRFVVMMAGPGVPGIDILVEQGLLIGRAGGSPDEALVINARIQRGMADIAAHEPDPSVAADRMRAFMKAELAQLPPEVREAAADQVSDQAVDRAVAQMNSPWFRYFLSYDPRPALEHVSVPVLAIVGSKDLQVPPSQSMPEIEAALAHGGNPDVTLRVLPGLNHLFQTAGTGSPAEYQQIEETMSPVALEEIASWINDRFGAAR